MRQSGILFFLFLLLPFGVYSQTLKKQGDKTQGMASYYGNKFNGRKTASGELFSVDSLTAAHPHLPFGSVLKVTHLKTGDTVWVRVNDRGPFVKSRILDLSDSAARIIGLYPYGVSKIEIELLHFGPPPVSESEIMIAQNKTKLTRIVSKVPNLIRTNAKKRQRADYLKEDSSLPVPISIPQIEKP